MIIIPHFPRYVNGLIYHYITLINNWYLSTNYYIKKQQNCLMNRAVLLFYPKLVSTIVAMPFFYPRATVRAV